MKLTEILTESEQQRIDELNIGKAVGKGIGAVAKGVGAVAGVPQGIGRAIKKGYKSAVSTIGGDDEPAQAGQQAAPAAQQTPGALGSFAAGLQGQTSAQPDAGPGSATVAATPGGTPRTEPDLNTPATAKGGGAAAQPSAQDVNKAGPKGTAPAQSLSGAAKQAADKTAAVTKGQDANQAGQTMYAQVKANIDKLDKKGKQRILQLLQKSMQQAPAAKPAGSQQPEKSPGSAAFGQMAKQLAQPEKSSTGGTITQTATGLKHAAKTAASAAGQAVKQTAKTAAGAGAKVAKQAAKTAASAGGQAVKQIAKAAVPVQQSGHSTKPAISESRKSIFVQK